MAKTTLILKDKAFRIVIPEAVRIAEKIGLNDVIEVDVTKINKTDKPKRPIGRPKKNSNTPCGNCGHYEDIHERDDYGDWTGQCLVIGCICTKYERADKLIP